MINLLRKIFPFLFPLPLKIKVLAGLVFHREFLRGYQGRKAFFEMTFKVLKFNGIQGDYVEFGCHGGMTFALAAKAARRHRHSATLWAFDSFAGLPETNEAKDQHPFWKPRSLATSVDEFKKACRRNGVAASRYRIVEGFYEDVLPSLPEKNRPDDISLVYVDCDLFTSTKAVLRFLRPFLKHGMILAFDDYYCWSATQISGERRAMLDEFSADGDWSLLPYSNIGWHGASFVVESRSLL